MGKMLLQCSSLGTLALMSVTIITSSPLPYHTSLLLEETLRLNNQPAGGYAMERLPLTSLVHLSQTP
jgi:hypothetical protein